MAKTLFIYSKTFQTKDGKKIFNKYFASVTKGVVLPCTLTENVKNQLIKKDIVVPFEIDIEKEDYFIKNKTFTKRDGTKATQVEIVVLDTQDIRQSQFESVSLDDTVDKILKDRETKAKEKVLEMADVD